MGQLGSVMAILGFVTIIFGILGQGMFEGALHYHCVDPTDPAMAAAAAAAAAVAHRRLLVAGSDPGEQHEEAAYDALGVRALEWHSSALGAAMLPAGERGRSIPVVGAAARGAGRSGTNGSVATWWYGGDDDVDAHERRSRRATAWRFLVARAQVQRASPRGCGAGPRRASAHAASSPSGDLPGGRRIRGHGVR